MVGGEFEQFYLRFDFDYTVFSRWEDFIVFRWKSPEALCCNYNFDSAKICNVPEHFAALWFSPLYETRGQKTINKAVKNVLTQLFLLEFFSAMNFNVLPGVDGVDKSKLSFETIIIFNGDKGNGYKFSVLCIRSDITNLENENIMRNKKLKYFIQSVISWQARFNPIMINLTMLCQSKVWRIKSLGLIFLDCMDVLVVYEGEAEVCRCSGCILI